MLKESQNYVVIEGILSEIDLADRSFKKDGVIKEAIGGQIKVRVVQDIEGETKELEIPISMFSTKITNKGTENPSYQSIERVMSSFKSIAAVGLEEADRVRITGAKIAMNEYYTPDGRLVSFPRVQGSFVTRIKPEDCKMRATWELDAYIGKMNFQTDKDGIETDTFEVKSVIILYGEKANILPIVTHNPKMAAALQATYNEGDTVPMSGRLNFSSFTETILEEVEIGEPIEKTRTTSVSEIIVTGVKQAKDEGAYDSEDIAAALKERTALLEKMKSGVSEITSEKKAPAAKGKPDLGF